MAKVFLGGTCNETTWRDELIKKINIKYFNPVVEDWTPECQQREILEKDKYCNVHLYVITPRMTGVFSIAEIIESSHMYNKYTVVYIMDKDGDLSFDKFQMRSFKAVTDLAASHGAIICDSLDDVAYKLNHIDDKCNA